MAVSRYIIWVERGRYISHQRSFWCWVKKGEKRPIQSRDIHPIDSKTTLLKCIAELIPYEKGYCTLNDKSVNDLTVPIWRSKVMYVPQRPSVHPGTPLDFFNMVRKFGSQKDKKIDNPVCKNLFQ